MKTVEPRSAGTPDIQVQDPAALPATLLNGLLSTAPLPQAGQFCHQSGELATELTELIVLLPENLNLLLLSVDKRPDAGWSCHSVRFWNPHGRRVHHRRSLPEMQASIKAT